MGSTGWPAERPASGGLLEGLLYRKGFYMAMQIVCCVCGKTKTPDGWMDLDVFSEYASDVSHGFCLTCGKLEMEKAQDEIEKMTGERPENVVLRG